MATPDQGTGQSVLPTQIRAFALRHASRKSDDFSSSMQRPSTKDNRSLSATSHLGQKTLMQVNTGTGQKGSFSTELRSAQQSRSSTPLNDPANQGSRAQQNQDGDALNLSEQRQAIVRDKIAKELKIKLGTENMLEALLSKNAKQTKDQRQKVEQELGTSNRKLAELKLELDELQARAQTPTTPPTKRASSYFRGSPLKTAGTLPELEQLQTGRSTHSTGSPTVVLTARLQELEVEGMLPDYYIERANILVDLFKQHPTLKYDLAWSVFSLRVQTMLLSDSSDVVAAGYRLTRHAIADRASLRTIRGLHTDELVVLSLVKKGKANLEREQALKFVRAFIDVKQGVEEIDRSVVRSLVAVAEHNDDPLKDVCILTLAELLLKHPSLVVSANGMSPLIDALATGSFTSPEGLVASLLHILDHPQQRQFLSTRREFEAMFAPFTDPHVLGGNEEKLRICAKGIAAMLKTWPGFLTLAERNASCLRSLIESLQYPIPHARDIVMDLIFDVLRIKPPSWSGTFLAGRRLTTYGRLNVQPVEPSMKRVTDYDPDSRFELTYHFSALVLVTLMEAGLISGLSMLIKAEEEVSLRRKATLLLTEVLKMAQDTLPSVYSSEFQVLGDLILSPEYFLTEQHSTNMGMLYQIASINKTFIRTNTVNTSQPIFVDEVPVGPQAIQKSRYSPLMDSETFRQVMIDTQVTSHSQYVKWKWDLVHALVEGPLTNPKRLEEAMKSTKFLKRLVGFYRPFKYRFSMIRNTRPNQRYIRTGCALIRTLMQTSVGIQYLTEDKLLRQMAECLAQVDRFSGLTSPTPLFEQHHMAETLSGGYFAMLGALSTSIEGVHIMERWHMMNMFYHIIDLRDRDDLIRALLGSMDFTLDTHLRVMLSQALTSATKDIRLFATKLLRRYAVGRVHYSSGLQDPSSSQWALRLVLTQLYDPDVEVGEIAVKILEEACDQRSHLEYVVKCRPSLDHLGEIGAPLLLRFLSTSVGYRYLSGLDYITQEMDDWFLGRNDAYVGLVEASLARAYIDPNMAKMSYGEESVVDTTEFGYAPPHFYRELARTEEGCKLLRHSGHFYEFAATIRDFDLDEQDYETLVRVKGCLWGVGNIGSMELGSSFLEEENVVVAIVRIAEGAQVMSMRGTACFVLGLISRSSHGYEMLCESGWEITVDSRGRSLGICLPRDMSRLCLKPRTHERGEHISAEDMARYKAAGIDEDPVNARVLKLIIDMGNSVLYKKIASELQVIKAKHNTNFSSVFLFRKTLTILESHHYRLQARQFILDLFDKSVMRKLVLDEELDDETESDTG